MKIFKKNELKNFFIKKYKNYKSGKITNKSFSENKNIKQQQQQQNSKLRINNTQEDKFPKIEENISSLLSELEKNSLEEDKNLDQNLNNYMEQKNEVLFINNNLSLLENIKLSDLIILNKTYVAKCLAVNNKVSTFVLFEKIK
jgi:hypothetical protein